MKKFVFILTILLLLFNGAGAFYGGWQLIDDPSGVQLQISRTVLTHTPFPDFLVPGIILLLVNGICSYVVLTALLFSTKHYATLVIMQGSLLTGWIAVQYFWTQVYHPLQVVMGLTGLLLISCGFFLLHDQRKELDQSHQNAQHIFPAYH